MNGIIANLSPRSKFNKVHIIGANNGPLCNCPVIQLKGNYVPGEQRKRIRVKPIIQADLGEPTCQWCKLVANIKQ